MAASSAWNAASNSSCRRSRRNTKSLARLIRRSTACSAGDGATGGCQGWGRIAVLLPLGSHRSGSTPHRTHPVNHYLTGVLAQAMRFYEQRERGLGAEFLDAIEGAFARIQASPMVGDKS